jgi:hypothetical protein
MFAMLVPQECSRADAELVSRATLHLSDPEVCRCMRAAKTSKALYECFENPADNIHDLRAGLRA